MRRVPFIVALLVVLSGFLVTPTVWGQPAPTAPFEAANGHPPLAQQAEPAVGHETRMVVELRPNGNAQWTVELRYWLDSDSERAAFRQLARAYEDREAAVGIDATVFRAAAEGASEMAGREMVVRNVNRTTEVGTDTGVLRLSFTWTNFLGRGQNETLVLRDAFLAPENETWLQTLHGDQELIIRTPPGYFISTNPGLPQQSDSLIIEGPQTFEEPGSLVVEYQPLQQSAPPWEYVLGGAAIVVAVVVIAGAFLYVERREPDEPPEPREPGTTNGAEASADDAGDEPGPEAPGASEASPDEGDVDLSLLSDEERVEHLLERNGGRMKQANIVRETGWSDAKVSQLLSSMAEEGAVEKLRLGRENLISLPDFEDEQDANS
jgi:uncharacterized membrane protein